MGSVGSGVAGEQEFAMKSVGTRTTLPRAPPLSRRCPADRSCSAERLPRPPATISDGTASSDERGSVSIGTGTCTGTDRPTETASSTNTECTMAAPSNNNQLECGAGGEGKTEARGEGFSESRGGRRGRDGGGESGEVPEALLLDQDSPVRVSRSEGVGNGNEVVQGGMSDSGRNSLTSLPTYTGSGSGCGPPAVLGPLSASTSHINRLGMAGAAAGLDKLEKPGYQNGLSTSDSGRSSSGKSSSSYQRLSHLSDAPAPLRPSPSSDDIIQDLEDRLWEKEQEVQHMRRNLDQSEAAIIQVFEEKQRVWERQMDELRQNYASRLQQVTRRAHRSQTALQAQITRLSQDKRRLQEEMAALLAQREELERKCLDYRKEQADILPRLEETKWEVCQKAGEISLLKQQLRESQAEVTQRAGEMVALRGQLKELNAQLREREEAMLGLKDSYSTKSQELEKCEVELRRTLSEVSLLREKLGVFEAEVLSLKRALSEVSRGAEVVVSPNLAAAGLLPPWGVVHCPRNPAEPSTNSLTPTSDTLLSLQSDEAKAQRQEAQRQERQQREEAQWRDAQQRQDAHMQQDIQMRQDGQIRPEAQLRQEAHLRHEAQIRQEAHLRQEVQLRQEAQLRQEVQLRQEAQLRHEAQMRQDAQLRHEAQLCQEVQLRQDAHQTQRGQEGHWDEAGELRRQLEQLQAALRLERQQRERQALNFDQERHTWQDEKERVLKYQAQLQLSYVETLQKNQALEKRMSQFGAKPTTTSSTTTSTITTTTSPTSSNSPPPPPIILPLSPQPTPTISAPIALTLSPPCEDQKGPPSLHQLAPPWAGPSRLERIESTEI
ncbi:putative leucine zipper putative tumor suppressor 3 [Scophthalmus maximus]|uniref:Putative leucine zipper putative tumor suppressor 3 n=1 Tax=Scophthalmus maximus TaxID=52904 RepID=A0A2U9BUM2_SCOMX|nr:putative leucine zipper putative tumor suppressor 3 [Scophthalmus maximus]